MTPNPTSGDRLDDPRRRRLLQATALAGGLTMLPGALAATAARTTTARTRAGRIGGTIEQPRITIDAKAALNRGLRNEVDRRLKGILGGFGIR